MGLTSHAPQTLVDLRHYLAAGYGVEKRNFGIRGTVTSKRQWGYHLGKDAIFSEYGWKWKDYSLRYRRDRQGLTNSSAAIDIRLPQGQLRKLAAYLVDLAKTGKALTPDGRPMIVEVIGPDATGAAKRWARDTGWAPTKGRADHEWHIHLSFYRDTEFIDKRPLFAAIVPNQVPVEPEEDEQPLEPPPNEAPTPDNPEQPEVDPVAVQLADAEDALVAVHQATQAYLDTYPQG